MQLGELGRIECTDIIIIGYLYMLSLVVSLSDGKQFRKAAVVHLAGYVEQLGDHANPETALIPSTLLSHLFQQR
jgi:hypothetical protein